MGKNNNKYDIIVVGTGLTGLVITIALLQEEQEIALIDKDNIIRNHQKEGAEILLELNKDLRTTALNYGARLLLEKLNLWSDIKNYAQKITDIEIYTRNRELDLEFSKTIIDYYNNKSTGKSKLEDYDLGYVIENKYLFFILIKKLLTLLSNNRFTLISGYEVKNIIEDRNNDIAAVNNQLSIMLEQTKENIEISRDYNGEGANSEKIISGNLLIAADGKKSIFKRFLDINIKVKNYQQKAIICNIIHSKEHHNIAIENFLKNGPIASLPLIDNNKGEHRSSIIYTEKSEIVDILLENKKLLNKKLRFYLADKYGDIKIEADKIGAYELKLITSDIYAKNKVIFMGDAARTIHPIAGQGFNLAIRDIAILLEIIKKYKNRGQALKAPIIIEEYNRYRKYDINFMIQATDIINEIFRINNIFFNNFLSLAMKKINNFDYIKQYMMKYAMGIFPTNYNIIKKNKF